MSVTSKRSEIKKGTVWPLLMSPNPFSRFAAQTVQILPQMSLFNLGLILCEGFYCWNMNSSNIKYFRGKWTFMCKWITWVCYFLFVALLYSCLSCTTKSIHFLTDIKIIVLFSISYAMKITADGYLIVSFSYIERLTVSTLW